MVDLLIDDLRDFKINLKPQNYHIARISKEAINLIEKYQYNTVYWDHDLGGNDTSIKVIDYLTERSLRGDKYRIDLCVIRTSNPVGALNLQSAFNSIPLKYVNTTINPSTLFKVY